MLVYGNHIRPGVDLGTGDAYAHMAATVAEYLGVPQEFSGKSFLKEILA